ncbi:MAG: hypothetical protein FJY79_00890 [Candidatus Aminicenantes bacterium]|nr:hypothetical protein [Candidatus Aminicenantes bacterium]
MSVKGCRWPLAGFIACVLFRIIPVQAMSASLPISPVRVEKVISSKLGETREAWVSLPDRYDETGDRYPVIYMLDGEINFNSGVDGTKDGGRADAFLDFVGEELMALVEKNYRTEPFRVLYGTSNTGFTAVHALFHNPRLAGAYVAASATLSVPIFRTNRGAWIRDFKGSDKRLILFMGENDLPTVLSQNSALKEQCDLLAPTGLSCRMAVLGGCGHVPGNSLVEGLRLVFEGWKIATPLGEKTFPEARARPDAAARLKELNKK